MATSFVPSSNNGNVAFNSTFTGLDPEKEYFVVFGQESVPESGNIEGEVLGFSIIVGAASILGTEGGFSFKCRNSFQEVFFLGHQPEEIVVVLCHAKTVSVKNQDGTDSSRTRILSLTAEMSDWASICPDVTVLNRDGKPLKIGSSGLATLKSRFTRK